MAEQMTWLTPQAVNEALTPAPLTNNVLAGMQQGQQAGFINNLAGLDVNDPDYLNKYATAAVKAGMDHTLGAIAELKQKNFNAKVGQNALSGLQKGGQYLAGTQSPIVGGQSSDQPAPDQSQAPAQANPNAQAGLHFDIADAATSLLKIPAGPERTQAAQQLASQFVQNHQLDPQAAASVVQNVNTPGFLENQVQQHQTAGSAVTSGAPSNQSPAVAGQAPTDTGSANPAGSVAPTPASPRDATYNAARDTLSNTNAEDRAVLKAYTPIDLSEEATNARTLLAPQLSGESTAQTAANTPYEATRGTAAGVHQGEKVPFASRAAFNADMAAHPGYWETPSSNELSGPTQLTRQSDGGQVAFANQAAAEQAIKDHPGVYGEPNIATKAVQGQAGSLVTITSTASDGSPQTETIPFADAVRKYGYTFAQNALNGGGTTSAPPEGAGPTRGDRNNNPTNMRPNSGQQFNGFVGPDEANYAKFDNLSDGLRAADLNLRGYGTKGINTPAAIAHEWAPGAPDSYAKGIAAAAGVKDVNSPIDLSNAATRNAIIMKGIVPGEGTMQGIRGGQTTGAGQGSGASQGGAQPGFGQGPSAAHATTVAADNAGFNQDLTKYTNTDNINNWQQGVRGGLNVKNLAGSVRSGPLSEQIIDVGSKLQQIGIPVPQGVNSLSQLQHFLALNLAGAQGVPDTNAARSTMQQALGSINNPSELLKFAGAAHAASNQYAIDYSKFLRTYQGGTGNKSRTDATNAWLATPEGRDGIFGVDSSIWSGATIDGKPVVRNFSDGKGGRATAVWNGRGAKGPSYQVLSN